MNLSLPAYAEQLLRPARYKNIKGGRGSAKSHTVGRVLLLFAGQRRVRVLCGREFQNSMRESVHHLLESLIDEMGLVGFTVKNDVIYHQNGSEFLFKGVRNNIDSIKSMEAIDYLWLEEANRVSQYSWDILIPTIRKEGSEIWCTYNPEYEDDPIHKMFYVDTPPENSINLSVTYRDNPWFPDVLRQEMEHMRRVNPDKAAWIWDGKVRKYSDAQILKGKWRIDVMDETLATTGPLFGVDWGFSSDPLAFTRSFVFEQAKKRILYVDHEIYGTGIETKDIPAAFDQIPLSRKFMIEADNARPETISHVKNEGFNIRGAMKWKGSVKDGISYLLDFDEIVIHPRCKGTADEARLYSYKQDPITGLILTDIVDADNHAWDSIRYAHDPLIRKQNVGSFSKIKPRPRKEIASKW